MWNETLDQALRGTLMQQCPKDMACQVVSPNLLLLFGCSIGIGLILYSVTYFWDRYEQWQAKKKSKEVTDPFAYQGDKP